MPFHTIRPAPPLGLFVDKIWDWDMPAPAHRYERVLPQPGAALIINLHENETRVYTDDDSLACTRSSASVLVGPLWRSQIIDTAEQIRVMGVQFRAAGVYALTGENLAAMEGRDVDLHDLFGPAADRLRQRLLETGQPLQRLRRLERWLCRRLRLSSPDPAIGYAIAALDRAPQVARMPQIAREAGLSERHFSTLFCRQVGMRPKHYARLMRFRAVTEHAYQHARVDWAAVAVDGGYADQAHLSHEFRCFAGITPSAFMRSRGPYFGHLPLD